MKRAINFRKIFNVGEKITLSEDFLSGTYESGTWYQDCVDTQKQDGSLTIEKVCSDYITVKATRGSWALNIQHINLYELEPYRGNTVYFTALLYAFANNQDRQAHKYGKKGNRNVSTRLRSAFVWDDTPEGHDFWKCISNGEAPDYSKLMPIMSKEVEDISNQNQQETTQNINNKNVSNHEIRLQKQKAVIIRGKRPEGSRIRYSRYEASI